MEKRKNTKQETVKEISTVTHDIFAHALFACCKPTPSRIAKDKKEMGKKSKTK